MKRITLLFLLATTLLTLPAFAIEGCKWCRKVEIWQTVYCKTHVDTGTYCSLESSNNCGSLPESQCEAWTDWAPKETGEKCETIGGTQDVSAILVADHNVSSSMTQWLNWRLSLPPGGAFGSYFSPYAYHAEGTTSCSPSSSNQTWTTEYAGYSLAYPVKIHSCSQTGSTCDLDVTVQP